MRNYRAKNKNILMTLFRYWIIIILWQYFRPVENRSLIDSLVKVGVFLLVISYAVRSELGLADKNTITCVAVFVLTQIMTVFWDSGRLSSGNLITIVFMFAQIVIFFVLLDRDTINEDELQKFCTCLLIIALIMSVYNVIFHSSRFFATFSPGSAYGHECKSFLYSNHEFGIYLSAAILSALWLTIKGRLNKLLFVVFAVFMGVNLLSTYSRTAILGCIAALLVFMFFCRKTLFAAVSALFVVLLSYIMSNAKLYDIVFDKIMKGSFEEGKPMDQNRASMYAEEFQEFLNGSFLQKLFGYGYAGADAYPGHDAYLNILLTGGIFMFAFFIAVMLLGVYYSFKTMRANKSVGSLMLGYQVFCFLYMIAQTPILFYSSMDSFFITMLAILIPKYVYNGFYKFHDEYEADELCG
jgi:hypothetical protein